MNTVNASDKTALLAVTLGNVFWGFSFLLIRVAQQHATTEVMLAIRFILAFLLLNLLMLVRGERVRFRGKKLGPILVLAITQPLYFLFESYGILYTNSSISGVALALVPVASIFMGILFLREWPTKRQALFCLLPIAGAILISMNGQALGIASPFGLFCLLLACLTSAAYKTANRKSASEYSPSERTYVMLLTCGVFYTVAALIQQRGDLSAFLTPLREPGFLLPVLALCVFCSIGSNMLVNYAASRISLMTFSSFGAISTLCSMFAGVLFLREPMTWIMALGAVLILVGVQQVARAK